MLTPEEKGSFVEDGRSVARRDEFRAAADSARRWQREHPVTLDDVLDFLSDIQAVFGPFPTDRPITRDSDFRL